jgi:NAD(P)-dependent dehydrogenase (short-subunit alcohol dehydrogenase family)
VPADLSLLAAASAKPAGGAALDEVALVAASLTVALGGLAWMALRHRRGQRTPLGTAAAGVARGSGLPGWAALPLLVGSIALVIGYVGFMWDVALHLDQGRDVGPLANPAHYLILVGIYGIVAAGGLAAALTPPGTRTPTGAVLICACGLLALFAFPVDDVWHRLFGQDVTLWGPTHILMLGGGLLSVIGFAVLWEEGRRGRAGHRSWGPPAPVAVVTRVTFAAALLIGLVTFLAEFDYGIPQFRLVFHPTLIALFGGVALVAAWMWVGRGAALGAVAIYLSARVAIGVLVGPILGETPPVAALFVAEALTVELAGLWLPRGRPVVFGAVAGLAAGLVGLAAEWPWTHLVFPIPWSAPLLAEGLVSAAIAGTAGGVIGALLGSGLRGELPRPAVARTALLASFVAVAGVAANGLVLRDPPTGARATVTLRQVRPAPDREVLATVRLSPADFADDATYVRGIAWQGHARRVGFPLRRLAEGVYRTPQPLPVHGEWKSGIRILAGRRMLGVSFYAPADRAIPAAEVPALPRFTRAVRPEREILQRERKRGVPGWLWTAAALAVLALMVPLFVLLSWGVARLARSSQRKEPTMARRRSIEDRVVLLTGGARGIGADAARRLVERGARVALLDRDADGVERRADALGERAAAFPADVTEADELAAAVEAALERFGAIDAVIANAGISGPMSTVAAIEPEAFEQVIDINLLGVWRTVRAALPHVVERRGYVLAIASVAASTPTPLLAAYSASKAGVENFARSLRMEISHTGTRVGVGYFGMIDTDMVRDARAEHAVSHALGAIPTPFTKALPVGAAGEAIARGVERRANRVYAPRWVPGLLAVRALTHPADGLLGRHPRVVAAVRAAEAERAEEVAPR